MVSVKDHYDNFLAEHYTWMLGDYHANVLGNKDFFERSGMRPGQGGKALDLGCGSGFQSIALAELGFQVLAIDQCETLFNELQGRAVGKDVEVVLGDVLDYRLYGNKGPFEVVVCMGDTLTHLQKAEHVVILFEHVYRSLEQGGRFVVSFRDLTAELKGIERIIPLRTEDAKLMATFLEYEEKHVNVHDMVFIRGDSGWELQKSVYKKLRIGASQVQDFLQQTGFRISFAQEERGFSTIVAQK